MEQSIQYSQYCITHLNSQQLYINEYIKQLQELLVLRNLDLFYTLDYTGKLDLISIRNEHFHDIHFEGINSAVFDAAGNLLSISQKRVSTIDESNENAIIKSVADDKYYYFRAYNGSMVTFYYNSNTKHWDMATARSPCVNSISLLENSPTFMTVWNELIDEFEIRDKLYAFMDQHRGTYSFSFIIAHPEYHVLPFKNVIFAGAYNLQTLKPRFFFPEIYKDLQLILPAELGPMQYSEILQSRRTYEIDFISECLMSEAGTAKNYQPDIFGIVMRSKDGAELDYYIPTNVMQMLKNDIYMNYKKAEQRSTMNRILCDVYYDKNVIGSTNLNATLCFNLIFKKRLSEQVSKIEDFMLNLKDDIAKMQDELNADQEIEYNLADPRYSTLLDIMSQNEFNYKQTLIKNLIIAYIMAYVGI